VQTGPAQRPSWQVRHSSSSSARAVAGKAEALLGDDLTHDLARSAVDGADDAVAEGVLDRSCEGRAGGLRTQHPLLAEDVEELPVVSLDGLRGEQLRRRALDAGQA